jgi:hypothetical protein
MRIVLILLMCWGVAFGQDTTKYFKSVDYGWNWQRGKFRGGLILPADTINNKLGIAQIGPTCFAWSGLKWNAIGNTDTAFLVRYYRKNQVDSLISANSVAYTLQDITTNGKTTTDTIIAASFKRTGGTSSQFLKANGSIDNSTYLTSSSLTGYVPYSSYGSNNISANNYFDGFTMIDASTTPIVLTVNSTPSYLITGRDGQTIKLPNATTLPNGAIFTFNNNQSSGSILVNNNSNTLIKSIASGANVIIELIDNTNAAGSWDVHSQSPSNVSWSTNTFDYVGSITGATWNGSNVAINRGGTGANTAAAARTNLGSTTVGDNLFTLTNPSAIRFPRINANNTISLLDSALFASAIGAGTVTSVARTNGLGISASVANSTTTPNITIAVDTSDASILSRQRAATTYQSLLVSGTNIKTVNSNSLLGSGNISVGTVTNVTGTAPIQVATGTTTPAISVDTASITKTGVVTIGTQSFKGQKTIIGANVTSATSTLKLLDSLSNTYFDARNDGSIILGKSGSTTTPLTVIGSGGTGTQFIAGNNQIQVPGSMIPIGVGSFTFFSNIAGSGTGNSFSFDYNNNPQHSTGNRNNINVAGTINTQSSAVLNNINIAPTYNVNANTTSSSILRGVYYAPTLTAIGSAQHRAWENTTGNILFGTTSGSVGIGVTTTINASAILQVSSTTQGFLPPRMTATQRTAIASPAVGLMVYQTDGTEGIYVYASSGWKMLTML